MNAGGHGALIDYISNTKGDARLPGIMCLGFIAAFSETLALAIIAHKVGQRMQNNQSTDGWCRMPCFVSLCFFTSWAIMIGTICALLCLAATFFLLVLCGSAMAFSLFLSAIILLFFSFGLLFWSLLISLRPSCLSLLAVMKRRMFKMFLTLFSLYLVPLLSFSLLSSASPLPFLLLQGVFPLKEALVSEEQDHLRAAAAWALAQVGRHTPDHARALAVADVFPALIACYSDPKSSPDLKLKCKNTLKTVLQKCTYLPALEPLVKVSIILVNHERKSPVGREDAGDETC